MTSETKKALKGWGWIFAATVACGIVASHGATVALLAAVVVGNIYSAYAEHPALITGVIGGVLLLHKLDRIAHLLEDIRDRK